MLVRTWVIGVVHARSEIRVIEVRVLVIEAERVADLLAGYEVSPRSSVVLRLVEIVVIQLHSALRDVSAASDPNLGDAEPAGVAVAGIADLHPPVGRSATPRAGAPRHDR